MKYMDNTYKEVGEMAKEQIQHICEGCVEEFGTPFEKAFLALMKKKGITRFTIRNARRVAADIGAAFPEIKTRDLLLRINGATKYCGICTGHRI